MIRRLEPTDSLHRIIELAKLYPIPCPEHELTDKLFVSGRTWIYEIDGKIEAFIVVTLQGGQPYIWLTVTSVEKRGNGIASELLEHVVKQHKGYRTAWMHVDADNPAQTTYFKQGFRVTDVVHNLYGSGKNGLVMTRIY